jgi:hypothetical protein
MKAVTRTVRYTQDEAREVREYAELMGEREAALLARASMRGLRAERFDRALMAYLGGISSSEAAGMAGMSRRTFIDRAVDRGAVVGDTESATLAQDLSRVAEALADERLAAAVASVSRRTAEAGAPGRAAARPWSPTSR